MFLKLILYGHMKFQGDSVPSILQKRQNIKAQVSEKKDHIPGLLSFEKSAKLSKNAYICCDEKCYGMTGDKFKFQ